jgi:rhamnosyltransferase
MSQLKASCIIPTFNGAASLDRLFHSLQMQSVKLPVFVVDSSSADSTCEIARHYGASVTTIGRDEFNHGGTRQMMIDHHPDFDIYIYMTQDAFLADQDSLRHLLDSFNNPAVGAAYGRQLPHSDAGPLGAHARYFNYPETSVLRSSADIPRLGIKSAFMSNSFAAYRRAAMIEVGGFPDDVILGEDMVVAARMVTKGWHIAYVAEAKAFHSHDYTLAQEFKRYFDIGVFHAQEPWLLERFGKPEGEGGRFVRSELNYLRDKAPWFIPRAIVRTLMKYAGYRLGILEKRLPAWLKSHLSMHRRFWSTHSR